MACLTQEKTIRLNGEDRTLSVTQLPAMQGVKLFTRLGRLLGPSLALLLKDAGAGKEEAVTVDENRLGVAVRELFERVNESEIENLIKVLLFEPEAKIEIRLEDGTSKLARVKDVFAGEFAGDLGAIVQAVTFALQVNFGNFFGDLAALKARAESLLKPAGSKTKESITSAGKQSA